MALIVLGGYRMLPEFMQLSLCS